MRTLQEALSDLLDEMALDKPIDWESINYEAIKNLSINHTLQINENMLNNKDLSEQDKFLSTLSIISYLQMENAVQWIMIERMRHEMASIKSESVKSKRAGGRPNSHK